MSLDPQRIIAQRYRLVRTLGRGAYGEVFEAARLDTNVGVALKVMHERLGEDGVGQRRFEREAEMLQGLRHPNIVQLLDYGTTEEDLPFIAFELLRGRTLREQLAYGPLSAPDVAQLARQVLSALDAAHAGGIIHRDIKPENVFLCDAPAGLVKLLDFGIAKAEPAFGTALTATGQMVGTPQYMAPEQVRAQPLDARADIYALGVLIAEACSGQTLVGDESQIEIFMRHLSDEPWTLPAQLASTPLGDVIAVAVAKKPDDRYANAAAMVDALDRIGLRDEPRAPAPPRQPLPEPGTVVAEPRPTGGVAPKPSRRWVVAGLGGAALLALGGGAGLWLGRSGGPERPRRPRGPRRRSQRASEAEANVPEAIDPEFRPPDLPAKEFELKPEVVRQVIAHRGWVIINEEVQTPKHGFAISTYTIDKGPAATGQVLVMLVPDTMLKGYADQPNSAAVQWAVKSNTVIMVGVVGDDPKAFAEALAARVPARPRARRPLRGR